MGTQIGVLLALASALIWGGTTVLARVFLRNRDGILLNFMRLLMAAPIYLLLLFFYGLPDLSAGTWGILIYSSLAGFVVGDFFFFSAMKMMGVSRTVLIATMYPVWVMVLSYIFLGRPITSTMLLGTSLIILAVFLVASRREEIEFHSRGVIYAFIAQFLWATAVVSIDFLLGQASVIQVTGTRIVVGALIVLPIIPWRGKEALRLNRVEYLFVFMVAVLGTVVAQFTFITSIKLAGSSIAAPVAETSPIISTAFARIFIHEEVSRYLFMAVLLTVLGIAILMM